MYYNEPKPPEKTKRVGVYCYDLRNYHYLHKFINNIPPDAQNCLQYDTEDDCIFYYTTVDNENYDKEYEEYDHNLIKYKDHLKKLEELKQEKLDKQKLIETKLLSLYSKEPEVINLLLTKHKL